MRKVYTTTLNAFFFHSSVFTLTPPHLLKFHHTLPIPNHFKCTDEDCDHFLPWLENKAAAQISSLLYIATSIFGRSLFACKNVQAGDCLLKVPFTVQITPDNLIPELKPLIADQVGNVSKLALVILVEQKKAQVSEWAPYITCLPQVEDMHSTVLDRFPQFFKDVSFENFRYAYGLVASRAWGSTKGLSLVSSAS
ncbi:hypothetical protein KSS87_023641 [Heliosperma pusillum]|nr:hypothetical protein KSS87_023641 [Heliosperma pusillum]